MLRPWLSLAVDYEGEGRPDPLPNLDLKLVIGDAIAGPDPQQLDFTLQGIVNSGPSENVAGYTTAQGQRKATLKQEIADTKQQLRDNMGDAAPDGVVEWRIDFADVTLNGGFDVVIANPPYVRQEEIGPQKDALVRQYPAAAVARSDLYCYFYARALQLLRDGGKHVFVCSNSWLDVGYGARLQEYLLNHAHIRAVCESAVERQFATADINTVITLIRKGRPASDAGTRFVSLRTFYSPSEMLFDQTCYTVTTNCSLPCLCAGMNSALFQLMANLGGRANFGGGLLRIVTYELANLQVVNPVLLREPKWSAFTPPTGTC